MNNELSGIEVVPVGRSLMLLGSQEDIRPLKMCTILCIVVSLLIGLAANVESLSSGAPSSACSNLMPNAQMHGAEAETSSVPYGVDVSPLSIGSNGETEYIYTPGQTYNCKSDTFFVAIQLYVMRQAGARLL